MTHLDRLTASSVDLWRNPSVMGVMLLQYVLASLLLILCFVVDFTVVAAMNGAALSPLLAAESAPPEAYLNAVWNIPTIVVLAILVLVQLALLTFVACVFTAGAYGMIRNLLLDGTTTFREFVPAARRYTGKIFRFALLRFGILIIPILVLVLAFVSVIGTTPGLVSSTQTTFLFGAFGLVLGVALIASLLLLYGEAIIVFEDMDAIPAAKRTIELVRKRPGITIATALLALAFFVLVALVVMFASAPLQPTADSAPSVARLLGVQAVEIISNVLLIAVSLIVTIFIFRTYRFVTDGVVRTTPYSRRKKKA